MTIAQHLAYGVLLIEHEMGALLDDPADPWGDFTECRDLPVHQGRWDQTVDSIASGIAGWVAIHADELDGLDSGQLRRLGQDMQLGLYGDAPTEFWPDHKHLFDTFPEIVTNPYIKVVHQEDWDGTVSTVYCVAYEIDRIAPRA